MTGVGLYTHDHVAQWPMGKANRATRKMRQGRGKDLIISGGYNIYPKEIDLAEIEAAARIDLAGFKRPRHWVVMDALPRNTMGKVQKTDLRAR